jgi:hypothetical protein
MFRQKIAAQNEKLRLRRFLGSQAAFFAGWKQRIPPLTVKNKCFCSY